MSRVTALTSTLYPGLPSRYRNAFRLALVTLIVLVVGTSLLRLLAPLIGLVVAGLPVLFVGYLRVMGSSSRRPLWGVAVLAAALGVGWALATEAAVDGLRDDALGVPVGVLHLVLAALAIPVAFVVCALSPVALARVVPWGRSELRKPLDGFAVGALSGYCFTAAGTLTRLAAEFTAGLEAEANRPVSGLAVAAAIQGLALPVIAAATAGAVGATLWSSRPTRLSSPVVSTGFALAAFLALGLIDIAEFPFAVGMGAYAVVAVVAFAFSRLVLRATMPVATETSVDENAPRPAPLVVGMGFGVVLVACAAVAVSLWLTPPTPNYVCPPDCGRPPISKPVATNPRFTPSDGAFSVSYPGEGTAYEASFEQNGVALDLIAGDGGTLHLFGEPAAGRTAEQVAADVLSSSQPNAVSAYEIPNALVGYQLGYGEVADVYPTASIGGTVRSRVLVMVAVKNDYALIATGTGPFREFSPDFGSGHPSGANFQLALDMGKYVNSFRWRGDPPR